MSFGSRIRTFFISLFCRTVPPSSFFRLSTYLEVHSFLLEQGADCGQEGWEVPWLEGSVELGGEAAVTDEAGAAQQKARAQAQLELAGFCARRTHCLRFNYVSFGSTTS